MTIVSHPELYKHDYVRDDNGFSARDERRTSSGSAVLADSGASSSTSNETMPQNLTCSDTFYLENSTCLPQCDAWEDYSTIANTILNAIVVIVSVLGTISGVAVIIGSFLQYKTMLKFPSVFLVCLTSNVTVFGISVYSNTYNSTAAFVLVSVANRGLFCSSKDLIDSLSSPTVFCILSGVVAHYVFVSTALWWLFHVASIFYTVVFPFHAKKSRSRLKHVYLILTVIAVLAPVPAIVVILTSKDYEFVPLNFPPTLCGSKNVDIVYYSVMLVDNIILAIGIPMLTYLLWALHKNWVIRRKYKKGSPKLSVIETKIFIALLYYSIFGIMVLAYSTLATADQDVFIYEVQKYFICEASGSGSECDRSQFEQYLDGEFRGATFILLGLLPSVNLIFVISWKKVKHVFKEKWGKMLSRVTKSSGHMESGMKMKQTRTYCSIDVV